MGNTCTTGGGHSFKMPIIFNNSSFFIFRRGELPNNTVVDTHRSPGEISQRRFLLRKNNLSNPSHPIECLFCIENFEPNMAMALTSCGHSFCLKCAQKWIETQILERSESFIPCPSGPCP
eukprot:gene11946-25032_t